MAGRIDITGLRFGRLVVVGYAFTKSSPFKHAVVTWWKCLCDCGKTATLPKSSLVGGLTHSCGCLQRETTVAKNKSRKHLRPSFDSLLSSYRRRAKKYGLIFNLTVAEFRDLTSSPCFYTGRLPSRKHKAHKVAEPYTYNGIDRLDPMQGYVIGNCVSCAYEVNLAKHAATLQEFLTICRQVVRMHGLGF